MICILHKLSPEKVFQVVASLYAKTTFKKWTYETNKHTIGINKSKRKDKREGKFSVSSSNNVDFEQQFFLFL